MEEVVVMLEELLRLLLQNRGRITGVLLGLTIGWLLISRGLWATLLLVFCVVIGYYFGSRFDAEGNLRETIKRIFPPF
jgi:uncharacterized membrane protein